MSGWKYYNHAMIPTSAPHEKANISALKDKSFWKEHRGAYLARWTTDFDCEYETNWWYIIKDTAFDLDALKAKRRYEINKGKKFFNVVPIDPTLYQEELYNVQVKAFSAYPKKYRPKVEKQAFFKDIDKWSEYTVIGAFSVDSKQLCGYALLSVESKKYIDFKVLKTIPEYEKKAINAALVNGVLNYFNKFLTDGGYICDGARSVNHETEFQNYIEKYFGFRKAYCKLNIIYRPSIKCIIKLLYPFRKILLNLDGIGIMHQVNAVLKLEEIYRQGGA